MRGKKGENTGGHSSEITATAYGIKASLQPMFVQSVYQLFGLNKHRLYK